MTSQEIRQNFLKFFEEREHTIVPSSSLIPDDPSVLLTTAGMQQFTAYLSGRVKSPYKRACSVQKCFRTVDIDEVGDDIHHTFFEMLGNWSFGGPASSADGQGLSRPKPDGYFKKEAIDFALEFLIKECRMSQNRLWVTIFKGEDNIPKDEEAIKLWTEHSIPEERISGFGFKDNFWGPTGPTGPCGPCSEIHYDKTEQPCSLGDKCISNCKCGRFVEIWNLVFMEYNKNEKGEYESLANKNIDTGIGLERLTAILQNKNSVYETDLFIPIIDEINRAVPIKQKRLTKIIADHIKGSCFLLADGVLPSNIEQGYILRRILRRIIGQGKILKLPDDFFVSLAKKVIELYGNIYPELKSRQIDIITGIQKEEEKFNQTLEKGLKQFERIVVKKDFKVIPNVSPGGKTPCLNCINGEEAFDLFSTYGFPFEMIKDLGIQRGLIVDKEEFDEQFSKYRRKHQELSRAGAEKKFGGHGLGEVRVFLKEDEEKIKKLHTATHLLHKALSDVLGEEVKQMGSDINSERLRFDFSYSEKMTPEQIKKVEDMVNQKIREDFIVVMEEMSKDEAIKSGALAFFKEKYGEKVKIYSIGDYSKEICAGPHVKQTGELGIFKIKKEQSSSAGVRRIKAVLE